MPPKPMDEKKGKRKCACNIRGIVEIWRIKNNVCYSLAHPTAYPVLRAFKFCPLCGKKLKP